MGMDNQGVTKPKKTRSQLKTIRMKRLRSGYKNAKRCGAKTKAGTICRCIPPKGKTRCSKHGGAVPSGIASTSFKVGKTKKYLPKRLLAQFENSQKDRNLLELRFEISLADSRIVELTAELDKKSNTEHFGDVKRAVRKLKRDIKNGVDSDVVALSLDSIEHMLTVGVKNNAVWKHIGEWSDRRQRLAESEQKRLIAGRHMISVERMTMYVTKILEIILKHVPDQRAREKISASFITLLPEQALPVKTKRLHKEVEWVPSGELPTDAVQNQKERTVS